MSHLRDHRTLELEEKLADVATTPAFDPEDVPLTERVCVARGLEVMFEPAASTSQIVPLAVGIDSSRWVSAELVVLLHSAVDWLSCQARINVWQVSLAPEDPRTVFRAGDAVTTIKIDPDDVPPFFDSVRFYPQSAELAVELEWLQFDEAARRQLATFSVYLIGSLRRPPDPRQAPDAGI